MWSRLPTAIFGLVLFAGCAVFFAATRGTLFGPTEGLVFALLGAALALLAAVAAWNLVRHEGWAVVLADDALELPRAPYASARRDRIPYAAISFVGLSPDSRGEGEVVVIHVEPGPQLRWIRQADLAAGSATEIARLVMERVSARRGPGQVVRITDRR